MEALHCNGRSSGNVDVILRRCNKPREANDGELDMDAEKKRNLKILQSMMGRTEMSGGESKRKSQPSSYFMDSSKMRFDPSKEDEMKLKTDEEDSSR